jgi:phenylacetate-CoA ligase
LAVRRSFKLNEGSVTVGEQDIDGMSPAAHEAWLVSALRKQIGYMRAAVPYWSLRLSSAGVDEEKIGSLADLAALPIFTKAELRALPPMDLVPQEARADVAVGRWTSGTTGRPTASFWTGSDWTGLISSTARMLGRHAPMAAPTVFNAYSQAHVTGPLYHAALQRLGATVIDRSHHPEDMFSTAQQMRLFDFDTLVMPARTIRGKGIGIDTLLDQEPGLFERNRVPWWIGSSGTFGPEVVNQAQACGIAAISNLYGSSEFAVFALSCAAHPSDFHVSRGYVLVEVVDDAGAPVRHGQFGRIVVTHLSGIDEHGNACVHRGTQILRLANGDGATLLSQPCECGLTSPRLTGIRRIVPASE